MGACCHGNAEADGLPGAPGAPTGAAASVMAGAAQADQADAVASTAQAPVDALAGTAASAAQTPAATFSDAPGAASQEGDHPCCCGKHKATPREEEFQADLQRRLNRAIGQLNGVKAMLDDNRYCGDVLTQLAAAESAVHRVSEMILRNHMQTCVVEQIRAGHDEVVDEAMALIHRFGGR